MKQITPKKQHPPYWCSTCGKDLQNQASLDQHLRGKKHLRNANRFQHFANQFSNCVVNGNLAGIQECLEEQGWYDIDSVICNGYTALGVAANHGHVDVCRFLVLKQGANLEHQDPTCGYTPLFNGYRHLPVVQFLIEEAGANIHAKSKQGHGLLFVVCSCDQEELLHVVKYLVEQGNLNVNERDATHGCTPLFAACTAGHIHIAKYLVEHGADPHHAAVNGATALRLAAEAGRLDICRFLVQQCQVNVNVPDDKVGSTPLHIACQEGHNDIVQFLMEEAHADWACRGHGAQTVLHACCANDFVAVARCLLQDEEQKNVLLEATTDNGETPLLWALAGGNLCMTEYLLNELQANILTPTLENETCLTELSVAHASMKSIFEARRKHVQDRCDLVQYLMTESWFTGALLAQ